MNYQQLQKNMRRGLTLTGLLVAFALAGVVPAGCASSGAPKAKRAGTESEDGLTEGSPTEHGTISKAGADQLIPKEKKRAISEDARADFDKAMQKYAAARKTASPGRSARAFRTRSSASPTTTRASWRPASIRAPCWPSAGAKTTRRGFGRGSSTAPPSATSVTWPGSTETWRRAEQLFTKAISDDPLHTVEARNNLARILRDKARHASGADEKRTYVGQAVSHLRTALALDSNNLSAFSTLAFIYYDMNMLEMAKLVGNQAIKKADEIATGKFEEDKVEEAGDAKAGKAGKKAKKKEAADDDGGSKEVKEVNVREAGTGVTDDMKKNLAVVYNTLGLVELREEHQPRHPELQESRGAEPELRRGPPQSRRPVAEQPRLQHGGGELQGGAAAAAEELRGQHRSRGRDAREQED